MLSQAVQGFVCRRLNRSSILLVFTPLTTAGVTDLLCSLSSARRTLSLRSV